MGMTFVWALELGKSGITVNAIAPAGATRMTASLSGDDSEPDPRLDPAMNAPIVAFLASDQAAHVNGHAVGSDAGLGPEVILASVASPSAEPALKRRPSRRRGRPLGATWRARGS